MTENIPQTSASERVEAARKAADNLNFQIQLLRDSQYDETGHILRTLIDALDSLHALITPPSVGESVEAIAERIADSERVYYADLGSARYNAAYAGVEAGIQSAHESWEPEVAMQPSQEQMLRWLGIITEDTDDRFVIIPEQFIQREEI